MQSSRLVVFLTLTVLFVACLVPMESASYQEMWKRLSDAFHYPLFFSVTLLVSSLLPGDRRLFSMRPAVTGALITVIFVFLVEILQSLTGRTPSEIDILFGLFGVAAACIVQRAWHATSSPIFRWITCFCLGVAGLPLLIPAYQAFQAHADQISRFPVIGDFEKPSDMWLWRTTGPIVTSPNYLGRSSNWMKNGKFSMIFVSKGETFDGIEYNAGLQDWSRYRELIIPLFTTNGPLELTVRIDDDDPSTVEYDGRFNKSFSFNPGEHEIRIPLTEIATGPKNRELNLKRVKRLVIFLAPHVLSRMIGTDNIRLE